MFTFNKGVWQIKQKDFILKYGYTDEKGRFALKNTLYFQKPIAQGLYLDVDEKKNLIHLVDQKSGEILASWDVYVIVGIFMTKLSRLLMVLADRKIVHGEEYFHYNEAYLLTEPSPRSFLKAFRNSLIAIDLRMHIKDKGSVRNRGTAFRIRERDLIELYENKRKLI